MNIALFSAVRYDSVIGGRTRRLCDELSCRHHVHFIEMPSLRHPCFCGMTRVSDRITRYSIMPMPRLWQHFDSFWGKWWIRNTGGFLRRYLPGDTHAIVSTPFWTPVLEQMKFASITYDCLDHISVQAPEPFSETATILENTLLDRADNIVCVSSKLTALMGWKTGKKVHLITNGFPSEYLQENITYPSHPTAGFCGAMYEWFDVQLIREAALALPDVRFILTGPVRRKSDLDILRRISNIEISPAVPFEQVKKEILRYSVGLIPFKRDTISFFCNPLKAYEYLALGRPVVSTVPSEEDIPVSYTGNNVEFISELDRLLHTPSIPAVDRNRFKEYTWGNIASKFERILK